MKCPNCGADLPSTPAEKQVEALVLDAALLEYCKRTAPSLDPAAEMEDFKLRMSANGCKVGKVVLKNARSAFMYHIRQAVKFSAGRNTGSVRPVKPRVAERKDL